MNVLYIAIDTLRADRLGCYGHDRATSPQLDALAARGVRFANHISPHIPTHPGYTTMFTGKDVLTHQVVCQGGQVVLHEGIRTLPQIMQRHGYFTAAADNLGRWFTRGYDVYEGYAWAHKGTRPIRKAEAVNKTALRVMDQCDKQDKPWFCFLHYWDPHTPYLPPPPFHRMFYSGNEKARKHTSAVEMMEHYPPFQWFFRDWMPGLRDVEFPKAQYDASIAYVDSCLSHVFAKLATMRGGQDTLVVVTSDHGEELDEHQMWFDHHGLYDTNTHVPLIMAHPERMAGGQVREGLTRHMDIAPTVLDLAGLGEVAAEEKMEGTSLVAPTVESGVGALTERDLVYLTECTWMKKRGFRTPRYKYIESLYDEMHRRPPFELYDLQADPGEQANLADAQPQLLAEFQQKMRQFLERRLAETGLPDPQSYQEITMTQVGAPPVEHKT